MTDYVQFSRADQYLNAESVLADVLASRLGGQEVNATAVSPVLRHLVDDLRRAHFHDWLRALDRIGSRRMTDLGTLRAAEARARSGVRKAAFMGHGGSQSMTLALDAYAAAVEARVKAEIAAIVKQAAGKW